MSEMKFGEISEITGLFYVQAIRFRPDMYAVRVRLENGVATPAVWANRRLERFEASVQAQAR
jgi:hypothetical protein